MYTRKNGKAGIIARAFLSKKPVGSKKIRLLPLFTHLFRILYSGSGGMGCDRGSAVISLADLAMQSLLQGRVRSRTFAEA